MQAPCDQCIPTNLQTWLVYCKCFCFYLCPEMTGYINSSLYHLLMFLCLLFYLLFILLGFVIFWLTADFSHLSSFLSDHNNKVEVPKPHEHCIALIKLSVSQRGIRCSAPLWVTLSVWIMPLCSQETKLSCICRQSAAQQRAHKVAPVCSHLLTHPVSDGWMN